MIEITLYTDPACPFAFSAEPVRQRLRWHYGDGLAWSVRMIALTREEGEAEKLAHGAPSLQKRYGMPIDPAPYVRASSSEPACRAVVAARLHAPQGEAPLLRALRVRRMAGGLLDDPELIAAAARDAGLEPDALEAWVDTPEVAEALEADVHAARSPAPAARAQDHKLGGPRDARRYTAPSYELAGPGGTFSLPGFNPFEAYDAAIANLDPSIERAAEPESAGEVLEWACEPLATAEVAALLGRGIERAREQLVNVGRFEPAGADGYWTLTPG